MVYLNVFLWAAGLLALLWAVLGWLLQPCFDAGMVTICYCSGDGGDLERKVRAYGWLRSSRLGHGRFLIVDCGLSEQGLTLVQCLRARRDWVTYCPRPCLEDCLALLEDCI